MAEVFKAKSYGVEGFEKIIAIKRILPTMGEDRDFIKMFIDEAKIAGQLAHANICQIFELGRIDGSHFIAMEYIWGKDLLQIQNRLRKNKQPMPVPMACFVIAKVLEGLDYAHRKRDPLGRPLEIVHRDCSPQNVLVSYEGEVKVIDFGIAKATSRNSRTMAGVLKGKFGYMSPEQVRGLPLDRRSDIFAIGTMLYECLTGDRLFQGETDFSTLEKVRNVDIQAPRAVNPDIPEAVEQVILKALAKDVDNRYQWCSEMLADLQQFLMSEAVVFTAKTLSGWLRDVFIHEIERERGLLEQYKRVGRDGLIAGVAAAEAKVDLVATLGEAGMPEGDATTLGGPNFDDLEAAQAAPPEVAPAPPPAGGPRGSVQRKGAQLPQANSDDDDSEGDFGEEAPTEIFGELDNEAPAVATPAAGRPPTRPSSTMPLRPSRPSTGAPEPLISAVPGARQTGRRLPTPGTYSTPAPDGALPYPGYGNSPTTPPPMGTPGPQLAAPGIMPNGSQPQANANADVDGSASRTVLGVQAPQGLPNYANYRTPPGSPAQPYGYQPPQGSPSPYVGAGYPTSSGPYGQAPQYPSMFPPAQAANATDPMEGRRPTLVRDIMIGVGIAVCVLAVFLAFKMLVLDGDDKPAAAPASKFATVRLRMPAGMTAEMIVDGERAARVENDKQIPVAPGVRHIKLIGNNGVTCDDPKVSLEAGKLITLECGLTPAGSAEPKLPAPSEKPVSDETHGYLELISKPEAVVIIDGEDSGMKTPVTGKALALREGKHKVTFVIGNDRFTYNVSIKAGLTERLKKDLK